MAKVLIPQDITEVGKKMLREKGYEVIIGSGFDEDTIIREVADCDAMIVRTAKYPRRVLEAGKKLKIVARYGIGVDNIDLDAANELGIWVTNSPRSSANAVAEHTIMMLLCCARNLYAIEKQFRREGGDYGVRGRFQATELPGKVLGLVGYGRIGGAVGRKASLGLGMKVKVHDPYLKEAPDGVELVKELPDLLAESDFVSLHLPLTPESRGMFDYNLIAKMKPTAILLNLARGEIMNQDDLIRALREKVIAGAGLDVFIPEPLPGDSPLLTMDNVMLTPHNASMTRDAMDIMGIDAAASIEEVMAGKKPSWPVNNPSL